MKLSFRHRNICGKDLFYPECLTAKTIVGLTGRKCFRISELDTLEQIGFDVEIFTTNEELSYGAKNVRGS